MAKGSASRRNVLGACVFAAAAITLPARAAGSRERIKITRVELRKVVVPMQDDIINSAEFTPDALTEFPSIPKYMIKLHTDSGILGIGETHRGVEDSSMRRNANFLQGKNVFDLDLPRLNMPDRGGYVGFQMALYDAMGKALSYQRVDDLVTNPFERKDSYVTVPDRPGLGVDLDEEAVKRYQVQ